MWNYNQFDENSVKHTSPEILLAHKNDKIYWKIFGKYFRSLTRKAKMRNILILFTFSLTSLLVSIISFGIPVRWNTFFCSFESVSKDIYSYENCSRSFNGHWVKHQPTLNKVSRAMTKGLLCHMRTTKAQISLRIRAVWSAPLLFAA